MEGVSVPPGVESAIDVSASISAAGDLAQYLRFQLGQGLASSGGASAPTEMILGLGLAREMMSGDRSLLAPSPAPLQQPAPSRPDPLESLTLDKVASLLCLPLDKVEQAVKSGQLKSHRVLGELRVRRQDVECLFESPPPHPAANLPSPTPAE